MNDAGTRKALFDAAGVEPGSLDAASHVRVHGQEMARWGKVVKEAGIKLE